MAVTGDTHRLRQLAAQFESVARGGFREAMLKNVAQEGARQVVLGFEQERDPYGRPWAPLKSRSGQILQDTGRMKNSFTAGARATSDGFKLTTEVGYVEFHQDGTRSIPRRQMVPENGDLPPLWAHDIAGVIGSYLRRQFSVV